MLDLVKNAFIRHTAPSPKSSTSSERDRLAAEIELLRHTRVELGLLVRSHRRDAAELDTLEADIAELERKLEALDATEVATVAREVRLRELMPPRIETMREQHRDFHAQLEVLAQKQADLERTAAQFEADFANEYGCVPPVAHDLLAFCRAWRREFSRARMKNNAQRFRCVVLGEQPPAPRVSPLDLMTPEERLELQERARRPSRYRETVHFELPS